ncbi:hypothetical protein O6H91_05G061000 [Diphasiastrum complanatum]|uniref:Uncharacterized protein n=1 Tax=Diphasiastrum complanatum TaxID=34168 RepID=A0ACC2DNY8_DIPCM|nr:hypothetical protein O6H91_05G061000 [Diphasiastrum complanatum]
MGSYYLCGITTKDKKTHHLNLLMNSSSMKRHRDHDSSFGPHLKRPASASGESSEPVQTAAGSQGVTTQDDALQYLKAVKDRFKDDKDNYDDFLEVFQHFKEQRIDPAGVIARVKDLFKGHPRLIIGFNTFLPKGYEITLPLEEDTPPPPKKQPVDYVNKIKTRFEHDEQVYKAFLEILTTCRKGNKSICAVHREVASLFRHHPDLLEEFTYFLPDSTGPVNVSGPLASKASSSVRRDDASTVMGSARHSQSERVVKKDKVGAVHIDCDRGLELADEQEIDRSASKVEKEQRRKIEKEREKKDEREHKEVIEGEKESELENDIDAMQRLPHKRKSARRSDMLIRNQSQVGEGGETFAGPSAPAPQLEDKTVVKSTIMQKELVLFDKIKGKLRNRDSYHELLKCVNLYSQDIINRTELQALVEDILGKHQELLEGFMEFLLRCESIEGYLADVFGRRVVESGDGTVAVDKDKERERERGIETGIEKDIVIEKDKGRAIGKGRKGRTDKRKKKEMKKERGTEPSHHLNDGANHKISLLPPKDRLMNKPISELDLSNCERCTPSYRLLPKNYPKPLSSHRTEMGFTVLNDNWVSVPSGSEDYSFEHMRKNQYEESLFCCEDDRFALDMLLESIAITGKRVGEMIENILDLTRPESQFSLDEHLSAMNLRCIEMLYGDHGLEVIDSLRKAPAAALPVVHTRLRQKHAEWLRNRMDMNKVWAEIYSKNHHKSLDHGSFYFKQQEQKSLSMKGLLTEIKEINKKKRRQDNTMLLRAVGNRRLLIPDLKFEYLDPSIRADLYQIVKYSSDKLCNTMEQYDKTMRIWTTFIEPMFGVPPRPHGAEDTEEVAKVKAPESKQSSS